MFGYVRNDLQNTFVKDTVLNQAMYCGLCKGIGKTCGSVARFTLNYDLSFLSLLSHNLLNKDVVIEKQSCIAHHVVKRPVAVPDELTLRIANLNVILAYQKLSDDIIDSGNGKIKRSFFKKAYAKAVKSEPKLNEIVLKRYQELLKLEKKNIDSIDIIADPFAKMMSEIFLEILGDKAGENELKFAYSLGKWIYLIDALDDFDKDIKKSDYNVFVNAYPDCKSKNQLILNYGKELEGVFGYILQDVYESAINFKYNFNHDLIDNIIFKGLNVKTKKIMENEKCKKTTKF